MKRIKNKIKAIVRLVLVALCLTLVSCNSEELEVQQNFPFELRILPVPKEVANGQTVEIRIDIQQLGSYNEGEYYLRYFQFDGKGTLKYFNDPPYKPNDVYLIPDREFRLYYTSLSTVSQSFNVWISDNFGNEKQVSFQFNNID
ncbi:DUF3872 domain-containing protein [Sphingobacterium sp. DR205]|uniref:DUF3872 domain-containing protein n=1 Tax=Sphingobacterium sp. DR205 TaxID=2713573 RepID=UPI0013E44821|nr:DUF3872 domain-containing protein [Sphingobacterium sp. DR205]QIH34513.1 DUF3872 domain-containing protein [Sphingobacterium sp. DR205]